MLIVACFCRIHMFASINLQPVLKEITISSFPRHWLQHALIQFRESDCDIGLEAVLNGLLLNALHSQFLAKNSASCYYSRYLVRRSYLCGRLQLDFNYAYLHASMLKTVMEISSAGVLGECKQKSVIERQLNPQRNEEEVYVVSCIS